VRGCIPRPCDSVSSQVFTDRLFVFAAFRCLLQFLLLILLLPAVFVVCESVFVPALAKLLDTLSEALRRNLKEFGSLTVTFGFLRTEQLIQQRNIGKVQQM
jgi:hypothetical protein